jgi:hypothetical protein
METPRQEEDVKWWPSSPMGGRCEAEEAGSKGSQETEHYTSYRHSIYTQWMQWTRGPIIQVISKQKELGLQATGNNRKEDVGPHGPYASDTSQPLEPSFGNQSLLDCNPLGTGKRTIDATSM